MADSSMSSSRELLDRILNVLSGLQGSDAYRALMYLAAECHDPVRASWLKSRAREQAARDAEDAAKIVPNALPSIGHPFVRDPNTETELFEQVMARLMEIADGVEKGPFSERGLFPVGIEEKQLQLWLAARLDDTPRRSFVPRFRVFREPTVDADNRTDIEVTSRVGKVCIEIKPLDETRRYSAKSMVEDTLDRQIVGQYLRGRNSRHGVLVLFRLDTKTWQIPGRDGNRDFSELVEFLTAQAHAVVESDAHVQRLAVVAIDCTPPK